MRTRTRKEWEHLYRSLWRAQYAYLTKEERGRLVRACRGRVVFDSAEEARDMLRFLQTRGRLYLAAYTCPLCHGVHIINRRTISHHRRLLAIDDVTPMVATLLHHWEHSNRDTAKARSEPSHADGVC
jgi:hypothetical protein